MLLGPHPGADAAAGDAAVAGVAGRSRCGLAALLAQGPRASGAVLKKTLVLVWNSRPECAHTPPACCLKCAAKCFEAAVACTSL